jgi:hypothetical protein
MSLQRTSVFEHFFVARLDGDVALPATLLREQLPIF